MIRLPSPLTPSQLLCCEDLSPFVGRLLEGSYALRSEERWSEAELCVLDAVEASKEVSVPLNRAVALVHLGDIHRDMGKLGPALIDYRRAQRIFAWQSSYRQRHNEAVASYALGLVHHLLGSEMEALKWYDRSTELVGRAKSHWTTVNALAHVDACSRLKRWIETLSDYLTRSLTHSIRDPSLEGWVPVVLAERRGTYVEQVEIHEEDSELVGHINRFRVRPLEEGWTVRLAPDSDYGAQKLPEEIRRTLHAGPGDHALIQWEELPGQDKRDRMEELGQSDFGDFLRDAQGSIYVTRREPRIIGGKKGGGLVRVGHIAALLEPTASSEPAVSSREGPGPSSRSESLDEAIEVYNKLLGLVGGSRTTASGLVEYERKQAPQASLSEVIERAIQRLLRDRRSTN
jgi:tetratricopeptide (TPR) repeat protein